ncbi:hypothetical protein B0H11DRAFT_2380759 [Mycena galericulata]|nr:hypothetical protein B0H11DRAFT_2380759 [Mycena galericulata]
MGKGSKAMLFSSEGILKKLVGSPRGKGVCSQCIKGAFLMKLFQNTYRAEQIRIPAKLFEAAATVYQLLLALVSSRFDYNSSVAKHMPIELCLSAQREVDRLIAIVARSLKTYDELEERTPVDPDEKGRTVCIRGRHGPDKDKKVLCCTIWRARAFHGNTNQNEPLGCVFMRRLEHIYSKPDAVVQALEAAADVSETKPSMRLATQGTTSGLIQALCVYLYKSATSTTTRSTMTSIPRTTTLDVASPRIHRRCHADPVQPVVQLGLACTLQGAYTRAGKSGEAAAAAIPHARHGTARAVFLIPSMLVEIPLLASIDSDELKRKAISKPFCRLLDFADRQVITGPPESTRDHIMQASKAFQDGEWEQCRDLIQSIKIWSLMPEAASNRACARTSSPTIRITELSPSRCSRGLSRSPANRYLAGVQDDLERVAFGIDRPLAQTFADKVGAMLEQNEKPWTLRLAVPAGGATGGMGIRARSAVRRCRNDAGVVNEPEAHEVAHADVERGSLKVWVMKCPQRQNRASAFAWPCTSMARYYYLLVFIFRTAKSPPAVQSEISSFSFLTVSRTGPDETVLNKIRTH